MLLPGSMEREIFLCAKVTSFEDGFPPWQASQLIPFLAWIEFCHSIKLCAGWEGSDFPILAWHSTQLLDSAKTKHLLKPKNKNVKRAQCKSLNLPLILIAIGTFMAPNPKLVLIIFAYPPLIIHGTPDNLQF